jgi:hypothetical protein
LNIHEEYVNVRGFRTMPKYETERPAAAEDDDDDDEGVARRGAGAAAARAESGGSWVYVTLCDGE